MDAAGNGGAGPRDLESTESNNTPESPASSENNIARQTTWLPEDAGCYVDGARGIYAVDAIVLFAEDHGYQCEPCSETDGHEHTETYAPSRFAGCEHANDIEDEATEFMSAHYPVDGHYWGRSEASDWGLWQADEN